jgi:hypothetical protein
MNKLLFIITIYINCNTVYIQTKEKNLKKVVNKLQCIT